MPCIHLIEGEAGCRYAVENKCVAIVVDALRASATAAALIDAGVDSLWAVREVEDAHAAKEQWPDAMLYGERGGVPPAGFDYGNSPRDAAPARGKRVIFTTTTGAGRLVQCRGVAAVYMGTTVNARAVLSAALRHECDIVLIPAGLMTDPAWPAQEDWVAATAIAMHLDDAVVEGRPEYDHWQERIREEGLPDLFASAPHAEKLRNVGMEADIAICAGLNTLTAAPVVVEWNDLGGILRST